MAADRFGIDLPSLYRDQNALIDSRGRQQLNALALQKGQMDLEQAPVLNALNVKSKKLEIAGQEQSQQVAAHAAEVKLVTDTLGALDGVPDEQLPQATAAAKAALVAQGAGTAALDQAVQESAGDPAKLRVALKQQAQAGLGYAAQLAQKNSDRTFNAGEADKKATLAETTRHNKVVESQPKPAEESGWQLANDPTTNTQYRINVRTGATVGLDGKPYAPQGAAKIASGTARSGQAMAMQKFMQENPNATSDDVARFAGHYAKTVAATGGETKADVASLTQTTKLYDTSHAQEQSINGAIGQVTALMNKGAGTTMGPIVNRWLQAGKKATGDKDVAAFNTAVETAVNEYAKLITGSTGATDASRAEAATMMDKFQSPEAILAQIAVIQKDGHFKVQSYADRKDAIQARIDGGGKVSEAAPAASAPPGKVIDFTDLHPGATAPVGGVPQVPGAR